MLRLDDTIAAIASPHGAGAARGVVRISGPRAVECLRACFAPTGGWDTVCLAAPKVVPGDLLGDLRMPCDAYVWPSRRSYTREPTAELHTLGSPPLLEATLRIVCASGARAAQPGEFTLRAFLAGRLDLVQAEAVLGVIDADDRRTLDVALAQMAGGLSTPLQSLRGELLDLLADLEAGLDFSEEHIEFVSWPEVIRRLTAAQAQLHAVAETMSSRWSSTRGPTVALVGLPNAGKSSLFNALAGSRRALVSPEAGTTRDYLQIEIDFEGVKCQLTDTAGLDAQGNGADIASLAQRMTESQQHVAELRLLCVDATQPLTDSQQKGLEEAGDGTLLVLTKCDRPAAVRLDGCAIRTSAETGLGLSRLRTAIAHRLAGQAGAGRHVVASTAARCRDSVMRATQCLAAALECAAANAGEELVTAELRGALDALGQVIGAIYTEDVLDRIFSRFCIGK